MRISVSNHILKKNDQLFPLKRFEEVNSSFFSCRLRSTYCQTLYKNKKIRNNNYKNYQIKQAWPKKSFVKKRER